MTVALRQEDTAKGATLSTAISFTSNPLPGAALIGSIIECWLTFADNTHVPSSVVDSASQTYSLVGTVSDSTDVRQLYLYAFTNNQSATALTVTANFASYTGDMNIHVREISGAKTQSADTSNFPVRFTGTSATDGLSIALTSSAGPALISGYLARISGSGPTPSAGTGFTGTVNFAGGFGFSVGLFESKRVTGSGSNPATWTSSGGGSDFFLGGAVIWDELPPPALVGAPYYLESDEYF